MILTDTDITRAIKEGYITITPFRKEQLGSNSYDLCLSSHLLTYDDETLDCKKDNPYTRFVIPIEGFVLEPGQLYLGSTVEHTVSKGYVPAIEGKSSVGRLGITAHITAGFGDVGFAGHWTLEITAVKRVRVYAGMPIAQIIFTQPLGKCTTPYNMKTDAKYSAQANIPVSSQMFRNFK